jgi:hypothetical protein
MIANTVLTKIQDKTVFEAIGFTDRERVFRCMYLAAWMERYRAITFILQYITSVYLFQTNSQNL